VHCAGLRRHPRGGRDRCLKGQKYTVRCRTPLGAARVRCEPGRLVRAHRAKPAFCDEGSGACSSQTHAPRTHGTLSFGTAGGEITTHDRERVKVWVCAKRDKSGNRKGPEDQRGIDRMESPLGEFVRQVRVQPIVTPTLAFRGRREAGQAAGWWVDVSLQIEGEAWCEGGGPALYGKRKKQRVPCQDPKQLG
jgi:hypothetical protein